MLKPNTESVRSHSAMSWAESDKWWNTHKGKPGGSLWKDEGWCREALDEKPRWNNNEYHKKIVRLLVKARLGRFIGLKNLKKKFFYRFCGT